ncbi:MAG: methionine ABC transporter permease [Chlamydiales bacterium]
MNNFELAWHLVPLELWNTLYMVLVSGLFAFLIGFPLGITLVATGKGGVHPLPWLHHLLGIVVNIGRSLPFAILIVAVFPFTRLIIGTSIGTTASIIPLTIAAVPFMARVIESALKEIPKTMIEAAFVMGASKRQIVWMVLVPEAMPSLVQAVTLTFVNLVGYSAMAGLVGGGGLGKIAIQDGYQRFNGFLLLVTLILILLLVELIQWMGNGITYSIRRKRGLI